MQPSVPDGNLHNARAKNYIPIDHTSGNLQILSVRTLAVPSLLLQGAIQELDNISLLFYTAMYSWVDDVHI